MRRPGLYVAIAQTLGAWPASLEIEAEQYDSALGLHVLATCYSAQQRTDGLVPRKLLPRISHDPGVREDVAELLRVGLWTETAKGYQLTDYLDWQESAEEVADRSQRMRHAVGQRELRKAQAESVSARSSVSSSVRSSDQTRLDEPRPDKTRPASAALGGGGLSEIVSESGITERQAQKLAERYGESPVLEEVRKLASEIAAGLEVASFHALLAHRLENPVPVTAGRGSAKRRTPDGTEVGHIEPY